MVMKWRRLLSVLTMMLLCGLLWAGWSGSVVAKQSSIEEQPARRVEQKGSAVLPIRKLAMTQHDAQSMSQGGGPAARQPVIALTFDDGPNPPYTSQILSTLRYYGVPATFFTIGLQVQKFPDLVLQAQKEGHIVGNHS